MADLKLKEGSLATPIDKNALLTDGSRAAGDYNNGTNLHVLCDAYLTVQFDTTAPSAGDIIAELYVLHGDGEASEVFPEGGDGAVGADVDPQKPNLVGVFETRSPSITVDEELIVNDIPLGIGNDRFVLKNISGQQFDLTWQLDIKTRLGQSV